MLENETLNHRPKGREMLMKRNLLLVTMGLFFFVTNHSPGCDISDFTASTTNSRINVSWGYTGSDCTNQTMYLNANFEWFEPHYADVPVTNGFYQFTAMRGGSYSISWGLETPDDNWGADVYLGGPSLTNAWWTGTVDAPTLHLQYDQYRVIDDGGEVHGPGWAMSGFPWTGGNQVAFEPSGWYDQWVGSPPAPLPMPDGNFTLYDTFSSNRGYEYMWGFDVEGGNFGQIGNFPGSPSTNAPEKLVGHWKFNAGIGTNALDSTTNNLDGVLIGSPLPTWTSGVFSNALYFDGAQSRVSVPDATILTPRDEFTIMTWIRPAAIT